MVDIVDKQTRSRMMAGIRSKDTKPEMIIRKALFARGFRYRLHDKRLSGKPDLVFPKYHAVIFINGCFWHRHNCHLFKWPSTRPDFWKNKINRNVEVDKKNYQKLKQDGWYILTVWECAVKGRGKLSFDKMIEQIATWLETGEKDKIIRGKCV